MFVLPPVRERDHPIQTVRSSAGRGWLVRCLRALVVFCAVSIVSIAAEPFQGDVRTAFPESIAPVSRNGIAKYQAVVTRTALSDREKGEVMEIEIALKMRAFAELTSRLANRELIGNEKMAATYYPLDADYQKTVAWLVAQGFAITHRDPSRLAIFASATVAQISQALGASFARVTSENIEYTSALSPPQLPVGMTATVLGVNGLQPHLRPHPHSVLVKSVGVNSLSGNGPPFLPNQIIHAYNGDGMNLTGAGQKIAIVIDTFPADSDLTTFWSTCGVSQSLSRIEKVQVVAGTLTAPALEATLDAEWSSAIAPSATVRIYATKDLSSTHIDLAYQQLYNDLASNPGIHQLSLSFGIGEGYLSTAQLLTDAQYFANLASAGVSILVSSGDGGSSPGLAGAGDHSGPTQPESPACDPNVTAVGGTSLYVDSTTGNPTSETAWYDGGGGISSKFVRPSWQVGTGVPAGSTRLVPDVSSAADLNTGGYLVLNGSAYQVGGTSWSAPCWAGFCALVNQARSQGSLSSIGLLGPHLYPLLGANKFRDIASGTNGPGGVYTAGTGYDLCTGLGTPNMAALLQALAPVVPALTVQPQNQNGPPGSTVAFSVSANGPGPLTYQWQLSSDHGSTWTLLSELPPYSGTTTNQLVLTGLTPAMTGFQFRCVISNTVGSATSNAVTLSVAGGTDVQLLPVWAYATLIAALLLVATARLSGPFQIEP